MKALFVVLLLAIPASAQPMMIDPSRMSGIPRPDPAQAAGSISVRVIRGDFAHPMAGEEVLLEGPGGTRHEKSDVTGHAVFSELEPGAYRARVTAFGQTISSQPMELPASPGLRVMLVFPAEARAEEPPTHDVSLLTLGSTSHFIFEVKDESVEVVENLVITNSGTAPYDPGPNGLRLPLPADATGLQTAPDAPASLTLEGTSAVWHGLIPPGTTSLTVGFLLPQRDHTVELQQTLPLGLEQVALIADKYPGMSIEGNDLVTSERAMGGRNFALARGPGVSAGGTIRLRLSGLPHASPFWRYAVAATAGLIALGGFFLAWTARRRPAELALTANRAQLLEKLAALPNEKSPDRDALVAELERIYRQLDGDPA